MVNMNSVSQLKRAREWQKDTAVSQGYKKRGQSKEK